MRAFALEMLDKNTFRTLTPGELKREWRESTGGRWRVASRDDFGNTSAAYKTLYYLESKGLIIRDKNDDEYKYSLTLTGLSFMAARKQITE